MTILILAAGYAVRLYPLTLDTPKPLLEVGGRRMIDRILDKIAALDAVGKIHIITNDKFFKKFELWLGASKYRSRITLINDGSGTNESRRGAIKDMEMAMAEKSIGEDLLVIAGDNLFEFDLKRFVGFAAGHRDGVTVALYDIGNPVAARRFGVVGLDRDGRIIDFEEKPERPKSTLVSTGVYFFPKEKLPLIKEYVSVQDDKLDAPGYCIGWLSKTDRVYGFTFSEDWCDIGDIESYREQDKKYRERGDLKDDEK